MMHLEAQVATGTCEQDGGNNKKAPTAPGPASPTLL